MPVTNRAERSRRKMNSYDRHRRKKSLLRRDPHCTYCRCPLTYETATIEHVVPWSQGGSNKLTNLALACWEHNHARGSIPEKKWREMMQFALQPGEETPF